MLHIQDADRNENRSEDEGRDAELGLALAVILGDQLDARLSDDVPAG